MKKPIRKRPLSQKKSRFGPRIDATRLAVAAVERIKTLLSRTGHLERLGPACSDKELLDRASLLGQPLPKSYLAALEVASAIGPPEHLLSATEMREALAGLVDEGADEGRLLPFCSTTGMLVCFDRRIRDAQGELGVVEYGGASVRFAAANFGEWIDQVADEREENISRAAAIPEALRALLTDLGFTFEDPILGRLETVDADAVEALLGPERASEVRGSVNRLFDSSGRASLTINLDEFTLACAVRTGIFVFEAPDVFRWLRRFRDQDFFRDTSTRDEAESVRDLRVAPREPPLVQRGVVEVRGSPSRRLVFRAAAGLSADDFFVLGRTPSMRGGSFVLHVERGLVTDVREVPEPLTDIAIAGDGTAWGLSHDGRALRFEGGAARAFPLQRPTPGRSAWFGIGASGERLLVWGAGALLEWSGAKFAPFVPDARLDPSESVIALVGTRREITMLVTSGAMGAVARFDGRRWQPIDEDQLIEAPLLDLDVWQGMSLILTRDGRVFSFDEGGAPAPIPWNRRADAFNFSSEVPRPIHGIRGFDGGTLLATEGGVLSVGAGEPLFYAADGESQAARLARVGGVANAAGATSPSAIVCMTGPHLWTWRDGALTVIDTKNV